MASADEFSDVPVDADTHAGPVAPAMAADPEQNSYTGVTALLLCVCVWFAQFECLFIPFFFCD
jgi:hypothetical protein